jgi:C4-type Zn-finger protein
MLEKGAFVPYRLDEDKEKDKRKIITISLNLEELKELREDMTLIRQDQLGKAVKQLMKVGQIVLHEEKISKIVSTLFINDKNAKRRGIIEFE